MARRVYATQAQYIDYVYGTSPPDALPADIDAMLARASQRIDRLLKSTVYTTDVNGYATDVKQKAAITDATAELVSWWIETGDETGALQSFGGSVTAGRISIARGSRPRGVKTTLGGWWVSSEVVNILDNAGLLGHAPQQISFLP